MASMVATLNDAHGNGVRIRCKPARNPRGGARASEAC